MGELIVEYLKRGVEILIRPSIEAFMNDHPIFMGIVGIAVAGGLILLAVLFVASKKKSI